jgi:hypothetical protein
MGYNEMGDKAMQFSKRKVALCCEDPMLQDYLRRVLEQCPTLEVICSPLSPPLNLWTPQ